MGKKILVVDDDRDILEALQFTLEDAGYEVITSEKGDYAENLTHNLNHCPDLIILDVLLSGKDGRTICKKLKNNESTKKIPIIMISAHPNASESAKAVGADEFIPKPFSIYTLLDSVKVHTA